MTKKLVTKKPSGKSDAQRFKSFRICTVWRMWLESRRSRSIQWLIDVGVYRLAHRGLLTAEDYSAITFGTRDALKEFARQIIYIAEHGQPGLTLWIKEFGFVVTESDDESLHLDKQELADGRRSSAWRHWRYREGDKAHTLTKEVMASG